MARKADHFRPRLGIPRSRDDRVAKRYLKKIHGRLKRIGRETGPSGVVRDAYFRKNFTGFGAKAGRFAKVSRSRPQAFRNRRVIIKARIAKLGGQGAKKLAAHLKYVERDGVSKDGDRGRLYNATNDKVDRNEFVARVKADRHTFRFIVSPEDAHQIEDMKSFTRELMGKMEEDLGTRLNWVAVDHHNTDNPHTHITVRGVTDRGEDLVIARDYIKHGMRHRASETLTRDLGPRQDHEIADAMRKDVNKDRLTSLDRELVAQARDRIVTVRDVPTNEYGRLKQSLKQARLGKLADLGLAKEVETGLWRLADNFTDTLRRMGERGDIIKTMHRAMKTRGFDHAPNDFEIFDAANPDQKPVVGRIISKGLSNEFNGEFYIIVDGVDGRTHYAEVGELSDPGECRTGGIVEITARKPGPRPADRTIAGIAAKENGFYDEQAHRNFDPKASKEFIRTHARRLEGLRRAGIVTRLKDGSWQIPSDYLDRVTTHERLSAKRNPVRLNMLTGLDINRQVDAKGATWLDRRLIRGGAEIAPTGFGAEVQNALQKRRAYLLREGFMSENGSEIVPQQNLLKHLERRELEAQARVIANDTGKAYRAMTKGRKINGTYTRQLNLTSGKFALIEKSREFTIVPWRPVLECALTKSVSGIANSNGISWDITKQKIPGISI